MRERNLIRLSAADNQTMFDAARSHRHGFERLSSDFIGATYHGQEGDEDRRLYLPLVVLGGFALELYLKVLLTVHEEEFSPIHHLGKLWAALPDELRSDIEARSAPSSGLEKFGLDGLGVSADGFIGRYPKIFEDWRYHWQRSPQGFNPDDLSFLLDAFDRFAAEAVAATRP